MNYSHFIYEGARASADSGDSSMNYSLFLLGQMAVEEDYAGYLERTYREANAFLQRASALGKLPCRIKVFNPIGLNGTPEFTMEEDFLTPVSVFQYRDDIRKIDYETLEFKKLGNKVIVISPLSPFRKIYIQYRVKVPYLGKEDICWITEVSTTEYNLEKVGETYSDSYSNLPDAIEAAEDYQFDLEALGFTDELLSIGVDWIRARLDDNDNRGHSREAEAESRLNDIEADEFIYLQKKGGSIRI